MNRPATLLIVFGALAALPAMAEDKIAADAKRGEIAFREICSRCHDSASRIMRRIDGGTAGEKAVTLEPFLVKHYAADAALRADIIAYLASL